MENVQLWKLENFKFKKTTFTWSKMQKSNPTTTLPFYKGKSTAAANFFLICSNIVAYFQFPFFVSTSKHSIS